MKKARKRVENKVVNVILLGQVNKKVFLQTTTNYYDQYGGSSGSATTRSNYGGGTTTNYYDQYGGSTSSVTTRSNYGGGTTTNYVWWKLRLVNYQTKL